MSIAKSREERRFIDVRSAVCPHPVTIIKDTLEVLDEGEALETLTDHRAAALRTIPGFCRERGYPFEVVQEEGTWRIIILKRPAGQPSPKVAVRGARKSFGSRGGFLTVIDRVDLDVEEGQFVCLVGPSGCGKSTLLNIIAGLEKADAGEVEVGGKKILGPGPDRVVIFQEPALFPWFNVRDNVAFGLRMLNVEKKVRDELVADYLKLVHLTRFSGALIHQLSGGMKQRVALARALAMNPEVLLMDEPFAALDAQTKGLMQKELQEICAQTRKTILFVTHDVHEAVRLGDRVLVFSHLPGRIKREFRIDREADLRTDSPYFVQTATGILEELREEVEKAAREEMEHAG
ncbi:MAG: ATP-binding cassette domain-containing protein [Actinobacteria bacterium]|nr:ATP-binding cassette domain-containing protein [Actinomycetota bacterium]